MQKILLLSLLIFQTLIGFSQTKIENLRWEAVVFNQPEIWYGTDEAIKIADNVLLYQRDIGGWPKNLPLHHELSDKEKSELQKLKKTNLEATIDNGATVLELTYLAKVYNKTKLDKYRESFIKGINYLLNAQYENGGWPQFYPLKKGYYSHITYNDNAMINVLNVLTEIGKGGGKYIKIDDKQMIERAQIGFQKGIECILKTQYVQNGILSVWCAQHDKKTMQPAKARAYELPSLSGAESAGIVKFLMELENPSPEIIDAIQNAVIWFDQVKLTGIRQEWYRDSNGLREKRIVKDNNAPPIWARFYDLKDNRPFFCDRDGIKKYSMAEIGHERRTGYGWYTNEPQIILDKYPEWQIKWAPGKNVLTH